MRKRTPNGQKDFCTYCGAAITFDKEMSEWDGRADGRLSVVCGDTGWWHEPQHHHEINGEYYFNYNFKDYLDGLAE